jgi:hypothetical protein
VFRGARKQCDVFSEGKGLLLFAFVIVLVLVLEKVEALLVILPRRYGKLINCRPPFAIAGIIQNSALSTQNYLIPGIVGPSSDSFSAVNVGGGVPSTALTVTWCHP